MNPSGEYLCGRNDGGGRAVCARLLNDSGIWPFYMEDLWCRSNARAKSDLETIINWNYKRARERERGRESLFFCE